MEIYIARNGQTLGPFDLDTVNAKLLAGEFGPTDQCWSEAQPVWQPLSQLDGVQLPSASQSPPAPQQPAPLISPWLQAIGAAVLLFLLWMGKFLFAMLGIPILIVLLLVSWNRPERMRFVFRQHTSRAVVRVGLGAALLLCFVITNLAPTTSSPSSPSMPSNPSTSSNMERRIENAEAKALRAEAAQKIAQRDKGKLEQKLRDEQAQRKQSEWAARQREVQQRQAKERIARRRATTDTRDDDRESGGATTEGAASGENTASNVGIEDIPNIGRREVGVVDQVGYFILRVERSQQVNNRVADGEWVVLRVVAVNSDKKTHDLNPALMRLLDDRDREYDISAGGLGALLTMEDPDVDFGSLAVQPDTPKRFALIYDVPTNAKGLRLKIPSGTFSLSPGAIIREPTD